MKTGWLGLSTLLVTTLSLGCDSKSALPEAETADSAPRAERPSLAPSNAGGNRRSGTLGDLLREKLGDQQEVLMHIADMVMDTYAAESALLRARAVAGSTATADLQADAARVFVNDAAMRIESSAKQALAAMLDGDTLRTMIAALKRLFRQMPVNTAALRRTLADATVAKGAYPF